jgi:hypothetical protein
MNAITKRLKGAIFGALLTVALLPGLALAAPFTNWSVSLDGVNYLNVPSYLQVTGQGFIQNTFVSPTSFTFQEVAAFRALNSNSGEVIGIDAFPGWQLTGSFNGYGVGDLLASTFSFTGGTLDLYASPVIKWGQAANFFGSEVGTKIASFEIISGGGSVTPDTTPSGSVDTQFVSTFLLPGYFFDPNGKDLITYPLALAFSNLTASFQTDAGTPANFKTALAALGYTPGNKIPLQFYVANSGEFTVSAVPEPGTVMLLGAGLICLAAVGRRKMRTN